MLSTFDIHWAAGFIDGEGHFGKKGRTIGVTAAQKDEWHVRKLEDLFGGRVYQFTNKHGIYWRWDMYGSSAAALMMTLFSLMSPRRQERIADCISFWKSIPLRGSFNRNKTHCKRGHEYTPENTYAKDGKHRQCRTCQRASGLKFSRKGNGN